MAKKILDEYLFVDGYNIINSWSMFAGNRHEKLEECRNELINIMVEYASYKEIKVIVVFDAHLVKGNSGTKDNVNGVKIVYTQEYETADHYIERTISKLDKRYRMRVATSDRLEQEIILSRGGTRMSARELEDEVFSGKKIIRKNQRTINQQNNYHFGKMDEKNLEKLKKLLGDKGVD